MGYKNISKPLSKFYMGRSFNNDFFWFIGNQKQVNKLILFIPLIIILIICTFLFIFLIQNKDPNKPPSALLDEQLPKFEMVDLFDKKKTLSNFDLNNKTILINFFASQCAPCKAEHPLLFEIKKTKNNTFIVGINHKDKKIDALKYLEDDGNPYDYVGIDKDGLVGLEFGVFGLPETFIINASGKIVYKHLGPLTKEIIKDEILPLL